MAKVVFVCISLRAGGAERVVSTIANYLIDQHSVTVLLLTSSEPFYPLDSRIQVIQPSLQVKRKKWWVYYPAMFRYIRGRVKWLSPDFVLSFGETINPFVIFSLLFFGVKKIVFNRANPHSSLRGRRGLLNPLLYPLADGVVVQTERAKTLLSTRYKFVRFVVLPNPIQVPAKVPDVGARANCIINVGFLGDMKNQEALIRAFASCRGKEEWRLLFVGDGPARNLLEGLAEELGIADLVAFLGQRSDVNKLLFETPIFAFTSLTEGFPNALAEALASGCACISYDCPTGPAELIRDEYNGILVELGNEEAFSKSLERLMNDLSLRDRLARNARKDIRRFETNRVLAEFEKLVLGSPR